MTTSQAETVYWRRLTAAPAPYPSAHQQAGHELDLLCSLILAAPAAAPAIEQLADHGHDQPEGALVLGALLHLAGHRDGSRFWWEFAAGGGSHTAASCLSLHHHSLGEPRDGDFWRSQAEQLARRPRPARRSPAVPRPLVPHAVRADLLARCQEGLDVRLPPRILAAIGQLPVDDDEDHGEVPRSHPDLVHWLAGA
ncbi:hypothetical protein [Kitasatospora viridis]|uniref:Uncharacterized protein n=1 Tax=Kitasatospora viridis TaxID=281105 RepID=A0A561TUY0_9ACTN|nr:hypothetical protein [Kitasatospora viridis]TWF90917.1 hypothetical protein FHX73_1229 [Kitasatospora viridis]